MSLVIRLFDAIPTIMELVWTSILLEALRLRGLYSHIAAPARSNNPVIDSDRLFAGLLRICHLFLYATTAVHRNETTAAGDHG
jgi:hypothetical protein